MSAPKEGDSARSFRPCLAGKRGGHSPPVQYFRVYALSQVRTAHIKPNRIRSTPEGSILYFSIPHRWEKVYRNFSPPFAAKVRHTPHYI